VDLKAASDEPTPFWGFLALDLSGKDIVDVSPLATHTNLGSSLPHRCYFGISWVCARGYLKLDRNHIQDLTPLDGLTYLANPTSYYWSDLTALDQTVTLTQAAPGTYPLPAQAGRFDSVTHEMTTGGATIDATTGTITYPAKGTYAGTWTGDKFSGTFTVQVDEISVMDVLRQLIDRLRAAIERLLSLFTPAGR